MRDLRLLGDKLRRYREQFQLSLRELSAKTGIDMDTLAVYETGEKEPSGDDVLILADFYKCDYRFFVSGERLAAFEQTDLLFRKYGSEFSSDDRWAVQEFLYLAETESRLEDALGRRHEAFEFVAEGTYYKGHGESAAADLRRYLNIPSGGTVADVYDAFRRLGFHVFRRKLENSGVSGLFANHPVAGRCILVNYDEDVFRQRFTVAHEAAHAIFDHTEQVVVSFAGGSDGPDLKEVRANTFASRLLVPPELVSSLPNQVWSSDERVLDIAKRLMVNPVVLAYSLGESRSIDAIRVAEIRSLKIPSQDKRDPELPEESASLTYTRKRDLLERGLSHSYVNLCYDCYRAGLISARRLAEAFLADEQGLDEILGLFNLRLEYEF